MWSLSQGRSVPTPGLLSIRTGEHEQKTGLRTGRSTRDKMSQRASRLIGEDGPKDCNLAAGGASLVRKRVHHLSGGPCRTAMKGTGRVAYGFVAQECISIIRKPLSALVPRTRVQINAAVPSIRARLNRTNCPALSCRPSCVARKPCSLISQSTPRIGRPLSSSEKRRTSPVHRLRELWRLSVIWLLFSGWRWSAMPFILYPISPEFTIQRAP